MANQAPPKPEREPGLAELGARLKAVRELNGLSQRELARRAGVTNSNISLIEQGQVSPSIQSLARLLDAIPLSLSQFFALDPSAPEGGIVRAGHAARTECPELGLTIESLPVPGGRPVLLERCEFRAGADTGAEPQRLPRPRAGWVIAGELELTLGVRCYTLQAGDGFHLPQGQLFRARNTTSQSTVVMITNGEP